MRVACIGFMKHTKQNMILLITAGALYAFFSAMTDPWG